MTGNSREACFEQIKGFGSYGFPESHAASFALLVYVSAWIKKHHPAAFAAALLNSQPMGFYAPAEIVRCAREHRVTVLAPDAAFSDWDCTLERDDKGVLCLQAGLAPDRRLSLKTMPASSWQERGYGYRDFADFARRTALAQARSGDPGRSRCLSRLRPGPPRRPVGGAAAAGRQAVAAVRAAARRRNRAPNTSRLCPRMPLSEHVLADYQTMRLSLKGYPTQFLRPAFDAEGIVSCKPAWASWPTARASAAPAWCWCASGRAKAPPSSSP